MREQRENYNSYRFFFTELGPELGARTKPDLIAGNTENAKKSIPEVDNDRNQIKQVLIIVGTFSGFPFFQRFRRLERGWGQETVFTKHL